MYAMGSQICLTSNNWEAVHVQHAKIAQEIKPHEGAMKFDCNSTIRIDRAQPKRSIHPPKLEGYSYCEHSDVHAYHSNECTSTTRVSDINNNTNAETKTATTRCEQAHLVNLRTDSAGIIPFAFQCLIIPWIMSPPAAGPKTNNWNRTLHKTSD